MKIILLLRVAIPILFGSLAFSQEAQNMLEKANELYRNEEYDKAIEIYSQVENQGYSNYEVYYNLGNAYYKIGNVGRSILNYEKAKKLNQTDEDIDFNLSIAKLQTVDKIEPLPKLFINGWISMVLSALSSGAWHTLSLLLLLLAVIMFGSFFFIDSFRKLTLPVFVLSLILSITTMIFGLEQLSKETDDSYAVIMSPSVYVKSAPSNSSTDLFILHEGTKLQVLEEDGSWMKIVLEDGNEGWITEENFERI